MGRDFRLSGSRSGRQIADGGGDGGGGAGGDAAGGGGADHFAGAANIRDYQRGTAGEGFDPGVGQAFAFGGKHQGIGGGEPQGEVRVADLAEKTYAIQQVKLRGEGAQGGFVGTGAGEGEGASRQLGQGLDGEGLALDRDQRAGGEQERTV